MGRPALESVVRFSVIMLIVALPFAAVVAVAYTRDLDKQLLIAKEGGRYLADIQAQVIADDLTTVEQDLDFLSEHLALLEYLHDGDPPRRAALETEFLRFVRSKLNVDQVRYLDGGGREAVRVDRTERGIVATPLAQLQSKSKRPYFARTMTLARGELYISPLNPNIEHGVVQHPIKPVIRFATPVFDSDRKKRGVLVVNYLGERLIERLRTIALDQGFASLILDETGIVVCGRTGRGWGFDIERPSFAHKNPEAWSTISRSPQGQFRIGDDLYTFKSVDIPGPLEGGVRTPLAGAGRRFTAVALASSEQLSALPRETLSRLVLFYGGLTVGLSVLVFVLTQMIVGRVRDHHRLAESEGRMRVLSRKLVSAQEDERERISRDLHDNLGQLVTAISLDLDRCEVLEDEEQRKRAIQGARENTALLLQQVRAVAAGLRPRLLTDLGLKDAIQASIADFQIQSGLECESNFDFPRERVPDEVSENLYRIFQEALTNVVKHARATRVFVSVTATDGHLSLVVTDDGVGVQEDASTGNETSLGITGMRERVELLSGTFEVASPVGGGTEIRATLPLEEPATG